MREDQQLAQIGVTAFADAQQLGGRSPRKSSIPQHVGMPLDDHDWLQ